MTTTRLLALLIAAIAAVPALHAQETDTREAAAIGPVAASITIAPETLELRVGEVQQLAATVLDADGAVIEDATVVFLSLARRSVSVTPAGLVTAHAPGEFELLARVPSSPDADVRRDDEALTARITVTIPTPPITEAGFVNTPTVVYADTTLRPELRLTDSSGATRHDVSVALVSDAPDVVRVDNVGNLRILRPGEATVTARAEQVEAAWTIHATANPAAAVELTASADRVRTGDVVHLQATVHDARGREVTGVPVELAFRARTDQHGIGEPPS